MHQNIRMGAKTMKKSRIIALILAAMMLATLFAGCSSGGTAATTAAAGAAASTTAPSADKGSGEPDVVSFGDGIGYQREPCGWWETEIAAAILERANVAIDYVLLDGDKYALELASGELQDVMYTADSTKVKEIIDSELALDLLPVADKYFPNLLNEEYAQYVGLVKMMSGKDKLYFIPEHVGKELPGGGVELARGYYVRWDWYKEIGCPEINSDDDFIAAMEQMVANHPTTEDGKKVYGIGLSDSLTNWYYHAVFTNIKCNPWTFQSYLYQQSAVTGELLNGYMDVENSSFWSSMEFYNKLWNKGLLDPDSFTMTSDDVSVKHAAGQYAACPNGKHSKLYDTMKETDPNTLAGYASVPSKNQLVFADNPNPSGWYPSFTVYIYSKSQNWEPALRMWNEVFDLDTQREVYCGQEGKYWNYVDGVPTLTDEAVAIYAGTSETSNETIGLGGSGPFVVLQTSEYHTDGYLLDLFDSAEMRALGMTPLQKDVAEYYGVTVPAEAGYKYVESGDTVDWSNTYGTELLAGAMTAIPTDISRILEKCNDILYRNIADLVMAETQEEFEALRASILEELTAADEASAWAWCSAEFDKAIETIKPIMGY